MSQGLVPDPVTPPRTAGKTAAGTTAGHRSLRRPLLIEGVSMLQARPPVLVTALGVLVGCAVAVADGMTGAELSLSVFYVLVVILVSSTGRRAYAAFISLFCAAGWLTADVVARGGYDSWVVPLWNAGVRFAVLGICASLVVALVKTAAQERLLSRSDALTGLANRRELHDHAERELARMGRAHTPLTVAYIDIDGFKSINDAHGHAVGDEVLLAVGQTVRDQLRAADVVARVGGDEFAVLLPDTNDDTARVVAKRLRAALATLTASRGWPVGFSFGVVTCTAPPPSTHDLLELADQLMYEAKRTGRNQVRHTLMRNDAARPADATATRRISRTRDARAAAS